MKNTKKVVKKVASKKVVAKTQKQKVVKSAAKAETNKKVDKRADNPGRPRNVKSANYKLVVSLFGEYISKHDMSKKQLHRYYEGLRSVYVK